MEPMLSLNGNLLIASPQMPDSFFSKSVILLLAHTEEGAAGLMINRPTEATVTDLNRSIFDEPFAWDKPIWLGGPVSGPLVILHKESRFADHEVVPGVFSTVEDKKVRLALKRRLDPAIIAINYSGWGPGQLEKEMAEDSWEVLPATEDLVFSGSGPELWKVAHQQVQSQILRSLVDLPVVPNDPRWN